jgi:predicted HicB family RNase H-like nuclease
MNIIQYKGYHASVVYESKDDLLVGRIIAINDSITFHGASLKQIKAAFKVSVDDYLALCKETGKQPDKTYSGKMMLRITPETHARSALAAKAKGMSLNKWVEDVFRKAAS